MDRHATSETKDPRATTFKPRPIDLWLTTARGSNLELLATNIQTMVGGFRRNRNVAAPHASGAAVCFFKSLVANVVRCPDPAQTLTIRVSVPAKATRWDLPHVNAAAWRVLSALHKEGLAELECAGDTKIPDVLKVRAKPALINALVEATNRDGPLATTYAAKAPSIFLSASSLVLGPDETVSHGLTPDQLVRYRKAGLHYSTAAGLRRMNDQKERPPRVVLGDAPGGPRSFEADDPLLVVRRCFFAPWKPRNEETYTLDQGGRFFGGFWRNMDRNERLQRITINGEPVVEVAFEHFETYAADRHGKDQGRIQYCLSRTLADVAAVLNEGLPVTNSIIVPRSSTDLAARSMEAASLWATGMYVPVRVYE